MRKIFTFVLTVLCCQALAQDSLKTFSYSRNRITKTGMEVLGSWAIANIGVGAAGWAQSKGGSNKYFYQMTTIWGAANLGAAILGFTSSQKNLNRQLTPTENLRAQERIEKTFLINGGFDAVYIGTGLYLKQRGNSQNDGKLRGYGTSIIMQGTFLLLFDATMYSSQRSNGNKLRRFLEKNPITYNGRQFGILLNID
jgi:hypothetical protein